MRPRSAAIRPPHIPPYGTELIGNQVVAAFVNAHAICISIRVERPVVAVVEANVARRNALCQMLSALDIDVSDYDSAESYLAASTQGTRCLITDFELPGMSGLELLRYLRAHGVMSPTIVLGEDSDVPTAVAAIREGATDFIEMPCAELAIAQRVAQLLRGDSAFPAD